MEFPAHGRFGPHRAAVASAATAKPNRLAWRTSDARGGVVQFLPILGYTSARKPPACGGWILVRTVSCLGGGEPPRVRLAVAEAVPSPAGVSQCGWLWPVISSRGLLPL